jgi:butyryl-CoA dehydrogenase
LSGLRLNQGTSTLLSRRDLDFLLFEWLAVEQLTMRERFHDHSLETFGPSLELSERIANRFFANHNKDSDASEPVFDGNSVRLIPPIGEALRHFGDAGLFASTMDYEMGGMQMPFSVAIACFAWFQAANPGTSAYALLTIANANPILAHGSQEQIKRYVRPMATGAFFGTMCLSEPQAGSALSQISTRAEPQSDQSFRLFGNKMWISGGDHELSENIVHLVLARIPGAPDGVKGLSLFIVPKRLVNDDGTMGERNDVCLAGLNHKMGYRGTTNTLLNFGEGKFKPNGMEGAVGFLVGERHRGLSYMFHMMDEARIGVGLGACAIGYTGYLKSLAYARNRRQGRSPSSSNDSPDSVEIIEHADVKRMLLAQKSYVEGALALCLYCASLVDESQTHERPEVRNDAGLLVSVLTPIAKSWPSQWCLEANSLAIQVHGGYGYTRDYDVEQHYRDNRLNPIHEGTHGIQALDLLGRKVVVEDGRGLRLLCDAMKLTCLKAADLSRSDEAKSLGASLESAIRSVEVTTECLLSVETEEIRLANASLYLEAVGHVVIAWIWLEQFLASEGKSDDFYEGKRQACRYFFRYELPKTAPQFLLLQSLDETTIKMRSSWF